MTSELTALEEFLEEPPAVEPLTANEKTIITPWEFDRMVYGIAEALRGDDFAEVHRRFGHFLWTGFLMISNAHKIFPKHFDHIVRAKEYAELPSSLEALAEGSETLDKYLLKRTSLGLRRPARPSNHDPESIPDPYAESGVATWSEAHDFFLRDPEIYTKLINEMLSTFSRETPIQPFEKPKGVTNVTDKLQEMLNWLPVMERERDLSDQIGSIVRLISYVTVMKFDEILIEGQWQIAFKTSVRKTLEVIQTKEQRRPGRAWNGAWIRTHAEQRLFKSLDRALMIEVLMKTRPLFKKAEWTSAIVRLLYIDQLKQLIVENLKMRQEALPEDNTPMHSLWVSNQQLKEFIAHFERSVLIIFGPMTNGIEGIQEVRAKIKELIATVPEHELFPRHLR